MTVDTVGEATIYTGDVLSVLAGMADESSSMVEGFGFQVEGLPKREDFRLHHSFCGASSHAAERIVFGLSEFKDRAGRFFLDNQKWNDGFKDSTRERIGSLPAEKGTPEMRACLLVVVVPSEIVAEKLDRSLVDHSDLNAFMVNRADAILSMRSLDPDVPFSVDKPSKIRNRRLLHRSNHTTPPESWSSKGGDFLD